MVRISRILAAAAVLPWATAVVHAQDDPGPRGDAPQVVVVRERSPAAAGVLEWAIPTAGYAYAGSWSRGIPPTAARITGFVLWFGDQFVILGEEPPCRARCTVGITLLLGGTIWGVLDAAATTRRANTRAREAPFGATLLPTFRPGELALAVRVPVGR
jgi:hypothetical protein